MEIHGNKYNYTNIKESDVINTKSQLPIQCNKCNHIWFPTLSMHINAATGCPKCKFSKGEIQCANVLDQLGLTYQIQYIIESLSNKRYDFMFVHEGSKYLLEFDGKQHFEFNSFFHVDNVTFLQRQEVDIVKTNHAISAGYRIIRISYKQINEIDYHIRSAISMGTYSYFSDPNLYQYILTKMR